MYVRSYVEAIGLNSCGWTMYRMYMYFSVIAGRSLYVVYVYVHVCIAYFSLLHGQAVNILIEYLESGC